MSCQTSIAFLLDASEVTSPLILCGVTYRYHVTIFFKQRAGRRPLALVKGTRNRGGIIEEAARALLHLWTGERAMPVYTLQVDISPTHHAAIIGTGGSAIRTLMASTGTK